MYLKDRLPISLKQKLNALRKASFHFRTIRAFDKALKPMFSNQSDHEPINAAIIDYVKRHFDLYNAQLTADLKAAHIESYLSDNQITAVVDQLYADRRSLFPLPKFNKLLARAKNTNITKVSTFPVSQELMKTSRSLQCQYIIMSTLYSQAFGDWLEQRFIKHPQQARTWMQDAHQRATDAANKIQKSTELSSKMSRLRLLNDGETLTQYLSYITSETAVEFAVQQNTYQSDTEQAKKQSNFVEDFKQDTVIRAFIDYLEELDLRHLFMDEDLIPIQSTRVSLEDKAKPSQKSSLEYPWLYLVLHLIPIEIVNHLSLQLRKHFVLTQQEGYLQLDEAISLFLGVHDSMLNVKSLKESEDLIAFYKDKKKFNRLFDCTTETNTNDSLIPARGLRELLRFGNLHQLKMLFNDAKVMPEHINGLAQLTKTDTQSGKSLIEFAQNERRVLHDDNCQYRQPNDGVKKDYQNHLKTIITYRELKNHVYLHHHKQAHQLMMSVMGRLVGFSQLWERDIYFVLLSLLVLRQTDIPAEISKSLRKGMILRAYDDLNNALQVHQNIAHTLEEIFDIKNNKSCRNRLAHIEDMRCNTTHNNSEHLKITPLINEVRHLMAYDRKLKNAVAKSIIDLALRHNISLTFDMKDHRLQIRDVNAKTIKHFNNSDLEESLHSELFIGVIKKLFD